MFDIDLLNNYSEEKECYYKDEHYRVRDNGSVFRLPKNGKVRQLDNQWTFGRKNEKTGYMTLGEHRVHIIVATAFQGSRNSKHYVVDHIDTNRCNNRSDNLRWLTKLENILLNEITRKKIEYLCGSVEAFLEDPSLLNGHEADDPNFGWMRAVTKEESENTLKRWNSLQEKPRKPTSGNPMGDWMFTTPQKRKDDGFKVVYRDNAPKKSQVSNFVTTRMIEEEKRKQKIKEHNEDVKKWGNEIISNIKNFSEKKGWIIQSYVKNERWEADILLSDGNNKIAIKLLRRTNKIDDEIGAMEEDGVKCYWLAANSCSSLNRDGTLNPVFGFSKVDSCFKVDISEMYKCTIEEFIQAAMNGKVSIKEEVWVKSIKVRFIQKECWKCTAKYFIYLVSHLICDEGEFLNKNDDYLHENIDEFEPNVLNSIRAYLVRHPDLNYNLDDIKERYSNTADSSYMSFGCPECDAIFGYHYLDKERLYEINRPEADYLHTIKLDEPGIKIKYLHWDIRE